MASGVEKQIEEIVAGEELWNPVLRAAVRVYKVIEGTEGEPLVEFGYGGVLLRTTQSHAVKTTSGLKQAKELLVGDEVFDGDGATHRLSTVRALEAAPRQRVINLSLEAPFGITDGRMLLANGIVTGDVVIQNRLERERGAAEPAQARE